VIDFSEAFAAWLRSKIDSFDKKTADEIDAAADELYDQWLSIPQEAFGGKAPAQYFEGLESDVLIDALLRYAHLRKPIPGSLCDTIAGRAECVELLLAALEEPLTHDQNQAVLALLSELQEERMIEPCMRQILGFDDPKADQATQAVQIFGRRAAELAVALLTKRRHNDRISDRLADIAASCGPCEGIFECLRDLFERRDDARAFYAQCLAKTGDERALPVLARAAGLPMLSYYDFVAIRDAIEELGGELEQFRDFSEDRDYMLLESLDDDK